MPRLLRLTRFLPIAVAATLIVSCGDEEGGSTGDPGDEREARTAVEDFHVALGTGNAPDACDALTDRGRNSLARFVASPESECEELDLFSGERPAGRVAPPKVDPVGVEGSYALAVVQYPGEDNVNYLYALRHEDGRWRIDDLGPVPPREEIERNVEEGRASDVQEVSVEAEEDLQESDETDRVTDVIVVGDISLAYETIGGGPEVGGVSLFVRTSNGWRPSGIELGGGH